MESQLEDARAYVERMRASGRGDADIASALQGAGWGEAQIQQLFAVLVPSPPTPAAGRPACEGAVSRGWPAWWPPDLAGGEQLRSPNGEFGLYLSLGANKELILAKGRTVQWKASVGGSDPLECAVTNGGYVVVSADTKTETLTGDILVFSPAGERILRKRLSACIGGCGLSGDAALAWCVTLGNPDNQAHSNKLFVFSLDPPDLLFRAEEPYGEIEELWRTGEEVVVSTATEPELEYRYSPKGKLLNAQEIAGHEKQAMIAAALREGDGYALLQAAEERLAGATLDQMTPDGLADVRAALERASACQISDFTKAKVYRYLGDISLASGAPEQAVSCFRKAIELNPKVGVKKQLQALEKDLSGEGC